MEMETLVVVKVGTHKTFLATEGRATQFFSKLAKHKIDYIGRNEYVVDEEMKLIPKHDLNIIPLFSKGSSEIKEVNPHLGELISYGARSKLRIGVDNIKDKTCVFVEPGTASAEYRKDVANYLFSIFEEEKIAFVKEPLLAVSQVCFGDTALIVDLGLRSTKIYSVVDGRVCLEHMKVIDFGGKTLDEYFLRLLKRSLRDSHQQIDETAINMKNSEKIKLEHCYVAKKYGLEKKRIAAETPSHVVFNPTNYTHINISKSLLIVPSELMFSVPQYSKTLQFGNFDKRIQEYIFDYVTNNFKGRIDIQKKLFQNIVPMGGVAQTKGFEERLDLEMRRLLRKKADTRWFDTKVHPSTWEGALDHEKVLKALPWVTRKEYELEDDSEEKLFADLKSTFFKKRAKKKHVRNLQTITQIKPNETVITTILTPKKYIEIKVAAKKEESEEKAEEKEESEKEIEFEKGVEESVEKKVVVQTSSGEEEVVESSEDKEVFCVSESEAEKEKKDVLTTPKKVHADDTLISVYEKKYELMQLSLKKQSKKVQELNLENEKLIKMKRALDSPTVRSNDNASLLLGKLKNDMSEQKEAMEGLRQRLKEAIGEREMKKEKVGFGDITDRLNESLSKILSDVDSSFEQDADYEDDDEYIDEEVDFSPVKLKPSRKLKKDSFAAVGARKVLFRHKSWGKEEELDVLRKNLVDEVKSELVEEDETSEEEESSEEDDSTTEEEQSSEEEEEEGEGEMDEIDKGILGSPPVASNKKQGPRFVVNTPKMKPFSPRSPNATVFSPANIRPHKRTNTHGMEYNFNSPVQTPNLSPVTPFVQSQQMNRSNDSLCVSPLSDDETDEESVFYKKESMRGLILENESMKETLEAMVQERMEMMVEKREEKLRKRIKKLKKKNKNLKKSIMIPFNQEANYLPVSREVVEEKDDEGNVVKRVVRYKVKKIRENTPKKKRKKKKRKRKKGGLLRKIVAKMGFKKMLLKSKNSGNQNSFIDDMENSDLNDVSEFTPVEM